LKILIEQIYGSQEGFDLHLQKLCLDLEDSKEYEALENGWCVFDNKWYLSRSTRIDLSFYDDPKPIEGYTFEYTENLSCLDDVKRVNHDFLAYKKFPAIYDLETDMNRTSWLLCKRGGGICAFTKFNQYDGGLESNLTAWDYSEPQARIGAKIVNFEIQVAKDKGYKYLYIGPGCGKSAKYKCSFKGFEWWNGMEWITDKKLYKNLCDRDDSIETLKELCQIYAEKP
jgi:hypothetical protein